MFNIECNLCMCTLLWENFAQISSHFVIGHIIYFISLSLFDSFSLIFMRAYTYNGFCICAAILSLWFVLLTLLKMYIRINSIEESVSEENLREEKVKRIASFLQLLPLLLLL